MALARPVGALKDGDILTAHSEMQVDATELVRSDVNCNVGVATRLFLSPDPDSLDDAVAIGNEAGNNFTGRGARTIKTLERGVVPSSTGSPRPGLRPADVRAAAAVDDRQLRLRRVQERHRGRPRPSGQLHAWSATGPRRTTGLVSSASNSGDDSELGQGLDVIGADHVSVYSQPVSDLAPGDTLERRGAG